MQWEDNGDTPLAIRKIDFKSMPTIKESVPLIMAVLQSYTNSNMVGSLSHLFMNDDDNGLVIIEYKPCYFGFD